MSIKKVADKKPSVHQTKQASGLQTAAGSMLGLLGTSAIVGGLSYLAAKNQYEKHTQNLRASFDSLKTSDAYKKNPEEFSKRFSELSIISPTVAGNPVLASKVIAPRLKAGFNLNDIHRLSALEFHTANTKKVVHPAGTGMAGAREFMNANLWNAIQAGKAEAASMAHADQNRAAAEEAISKQHARAAEFINTPEPNKDKNDILADYKKALRFHNEGGGGDKIGADMSKFAFGEQKVGDECLGRMIADRYVMYKTAAGGKVLEKLGSIYETLGIEKGVAAVKDHFQYIAPALVLGGGAQLVREAMRIAESKKLRAEADRVFDHIKRTSDIVKQNPGVASEAFDTLRSFAPSVATKPLVVRSFLEGVVNSQYLGVDTASMLAQTEQRIRENGSSQGFLEGLKTPMSLFSLSVGSKDSKGGGDKKDDGRPRRDRGPLSAAQSGMTFDPLTLSYKGK